MGRDARAAGCDYQDAQTRWMNLAYRAQVIERYALMRADIGCFHDIPDGATIFLQPALSVIIDARVPARMSRIWL